MKLQLNNSKAMKRCGLIVLAACILCGQDKPKITSITTLPSERIPAGPWSCTSGSAGYLEIGQGRTDLTDAEIGRIIAQYLRDGYTLTIYPKTKRGVFVDLYCNAPQPTSRP